MRSFDTHCGRSEIALRSSRDAGPAKAPSQPAGAATVPTGLTASLASSQGKKIVTRGGNASTEAGGSAELNLPSAASTESASLDEMREQARRLHSTSQLLDRRERSLRLSDERRWKPARGANSHQASSSPTWCVARGRQRRTWKLRPALLQRTAIHAGMRPMLAVRFVSEQGRGRTGGKARAEGSLATVVSTVGRTG
jgi:hypothetical protein